MGLLESILELRPVECEYRGWVVDFRYVDLPGVNGGITRITAKELGQLHRKILAHALDFLIVNGREITEAIEKKPGWKRFNYYENKYGEQYTDHVRGGLAYRKLAVPGTSANKRHRRGGKRDSESTKRLLHHGGAEWELVYYPNGHAEVECWQTPPKWKGGSVGKSRKPSDDWESEYYYRRESFHMGPPRKFRDLPSCELEDEVYASQSAEDWYTTIWDFDRFDLGDGIVYIPAFGYPVIGTCSMAEYSREWEY